MPEAVAEIEVAPPILAGQGLMLLVEIGDVVHLRPQALLVRARDVPAGRVLDLAEVAAEGDLLLVADALLVEDQDRVAVHPRLDRRHLLARQGLGEVAARDLASDGGMERADGDGHGLELRQCRRDGGRIAIAAARVMSRRAAAGSLPLAVLASWCMRGGWPQ